MAALLSNWAVWEQRAQILFLWSKGLQHLKFIGEIRASEQAQRFHVRRGAYPVYSSYHFSHTPAPYSPDLAASDYHRFGHLKVSSVDEDLPVMMQQRTPFVLSWQMEFRGLLKRYALCIEKRGHYVEKWNTLHLSQTAAHTAVHWFTLLFGTSQQILFHSWYKNRKARKD
jgi:hypothetical protein